MEIITLAAGGTLAYMVAKGLSVRKRINEFHRELENYLEQEAPLSIRNYFKGLGINTQEITEEEANKLIPHFKRMYKLPVIAFTENRGGRVLRTLRLVEKLEGNSGLYELLLKEDATIGQS